MINAYADLFLCYKSGQISERQWQEHLKDADFAEWLAQHAA
jgi:hypothetical protein